MCVIRVGSPQTGLWCRTGQAMVNNIAAITLWSAVIMFVVALLFLLAAAATWRQKRKGIREQVGSCGRVTDHSSFSDASWLW